MNTKPKHTRLKVEFKQFQCLPGWPNHHQSSDANRSLEDARVQKVRMSALLFEEGRLAPQSRGMIRIGLKMCLTEERLTKLEKSCIEGLPKVISTLRVYLKRGFGLKLRNVLHNERSPKSKINMLRRLCLVIFTLTALVPTSYHSQNSVIKSWATTRLNTSRKNCTITPATPTTAPRSKWITAAATTALSSPLRCGGGCIGTSHSHQSTLIRIKAQRRLEFLPGEIHQVLASRRQKSTRLNSIKSNLESRT